MKILIVDDDPVSRELLKKLLSEFAECEFAENGVQALAVYKQGWENWAPFDLMTLDISMPDMDGKEVLQTIRAIENEKKVPADKRAKILMTSVRADKETILTCARMGCDDYISKPFDKDIILKKIRKIGLYLHSGEDDNTGTAPGGNENETPRKYDEDDKRILKENIQRIVNRFKSGKIKLPVLPKIIDDVQKVMRDPNAKIDDLSKAIEKDAVISIRIIAGAIIKRWGFPDQFIRVILQHEGPQFTPETEKDVLVVNLAKNLAFRLGYGLVNVEVDLAELDATKLLDIDPDSFDDICQEIRGNVIGASEVY